MKMITFLGTLLLSVAALANNSAARVPASKSELSIECEVPKNFAGLAATVTGKLKLSPLPNGGSQGKGRLKISLMNPKKYWSGAKQVLGQYDDLSGLNSDRYFHGGATVKNPDDVLAVYINFSRPEMSYLEYEEKIYKTVCKEN